jgi:prevent-host-death family protein
MIISADEADQQFSRLLKTAAGGEVITITDRGVAVARIVPAVERPAETDEDGRRARRREELLAWFTEGFEGRGFADWTRDELYERDVDADQR